MPRSYFRTLPDLYERKAFGTDRHPPYPPGALACYIGVLCFGEQQPYRGRFKSLRLLHVLLEGPRGEGRPMARFLGFVVEQGDLVALPDGSLYIEGWDELQEGNWQVAERMSRYRARTHHVTVPVTPTVTVPTVTVPSRVVVEAKAVVEAGGDAPVTDGDVLSWLSLHHASLEPNGNGLHRKLCRLVEVHGSPAVVRAFDDLLAEGRVTEARQYIFGADDRLNPLPSTRRNGHESHDYLPSIEEAENAFEHYE